MAAAATVATLLPLHAAQAVLFYGAPLLQMAAQRGGVVQKHGRVGLADGQGQRPRGGGAQKLAFAPIGAVPVLGQPCSQCLGRLHASMPVGALGVLGALRRINFFPAQRRQRGLCASRCTLRRCACGCAASALPCWA